MMIRTACLTSLAVLTLAACDRAAPEKAAPPAAPAPAPSAQAPMTPVAANVLTSEGLGAAKIGMTLAELTTVWGPDSDPAGVGGPDPATCDEFHPAKAPTGVHVMIVDGKLARISLSDGSPIKTDRSFGVGDTGAAIKAAYGGAIVAGPAKYDPKGEDLIAWAHGGSTAYVENPDARGVRYEVSGDGKVQTVHAGGPEIQWVEGCA